MNDSFMIGDFVKIRRYKDLCCEYPVCKSGSIISGGIFSYKYISHCGHSFEIVDRDKWDNDFCYRLRMFIDTSWWFKDYLLEDHAEELTPLSCFEFV